MVIDAFSSSAILAFTDMYDQVHWTKSLHMLRRLVTEAIVSWLLPTSPFRHGACASIERAAFGYVVCETVSGLAIDVNSPWRALC